MMNRLIVCLVATFLLAACGTTHPSAKPARPVSSSPSPSITPSVEAGPAMPAVARQSTPAGAKAFAQWFLEVHNRALRTGDTAALREAIAPECFMCLAMPALIESAYRDGGRISGGEWIPTSPVQAVPSSAGAIKGTGFFQLSIHLQPMTSFGAHHQHVTSQDGSTHDRALLIWTSWRDGRWYVSQINGVTGQQL
jgi:hypothetical protein